MAIRVVRLTSADVERFRQVRLEGLRSDPIGFRYSEAEDAAVGTAAEERRYCRRLRLAGDNLAQD